MEPLSGPLVLLHGFGSTFDHNWRQTGWLDILGDVGIEVDELDLPGHGGSDRSTDPAAYADAVGDVAAKLPARCAAVGFSAGGQLLLRIAVAEPGRFERLVLLGVGDTVFDTSDSTVIVDALEGRGDPDNVQARVFTRLAETTGNDPLALAAYLRRPTSPLVPADLSAITCPVLVVLGDRDFAGPADRLVEALPDARLVSIPGLDHFATPSEFSAIDATLRFLGLG
jgi:pimeloyl-ACP methyl ester carboxylesterase